MIRNMKKRRIVWLLVFVMLFAGLHMESTFVDAESKTLEEAGADEPDMETRELGQVMISKVTAGKKKITVQWERVEGAAGYLIQISPEKNFTNEKKITEKTSISRKITVKKLSSGKKYYVRILALAWADEEKENMIVGEWSQIKSKKVT